MMAKSQIAALGGLGNDFSDEMWFELAIQINALGPFNQSPEWWKKVRLKHSVKTFIFETVTVLSFLLEIQRYAPAGKE